MNHSWSYDFGRFVAILEYCKPGYFRRMKFRDNVGKKYSRGGNFHDTTPISFTKANGFHVSVGVIFAKKTKTG